MLHRLWRGWRSVAVVSIGALALTACASADGQGSGDSANAGGAYAIGYVGDRAGEGDPVDGGVVTYGSYGFPATLDPTKTLMAGSTGGTELAAIYDTLVRYDFEKSQYVPQLAAGLESSDDGQAWTVTLRDGATFSDGTPVDSAAVKWSLDRYVAAKRDVAQVWTNSVAGVETPDAKTVVIRLQRPWTDFPVLLAAGPGVIVAPSSEASGSFTPIGAGPFTVTRFAPNEVLELAPRADYVGGKPRLAGLRFVPTANAQGMFESIRSGELNAGYLYRNTEVIDSAIDAGLEGYRDLQGLGAIGMINQREGRPGADVRVRRAIALGIDPEALNQRVNGGKGPAGSAMFPEGSKWHNEDVQGVTYDPDQARELLSQAKADGYNGKLTYVAINEEASRQGALAAQAALNSIGFDVEVAYANSVTDLTRRVYVDRDFDIARSGASLIDAAPLLRLYGSLGSTSSNNAAGYNSPEMDALLVKLQTAGSDDAKQTAIDDIQKLADETVPYAVWAPTAVYTAWTPKLHGANVSIDNVVLFDDAWMER
ncbi:ABC transporter substrate-binding protein [Rhodococcus hoagii]|uniref:High affinity substrate binding lipoprotein n=1 Tax=Rhodococcus hoagii (strain 103S) TaxID=685727 RepID=A0A3S5Y517_RHOH1|nr:ABC transporter substrate-binding protein [Prescottella equi]CBH47626.1 putative high affinity substrate binding lipoprotein [Prescottella equi 103S]NKR85816.1 ABC transporter substrate-binding protein [Prescottella equi]NKS06039.1 ABC transporter substrate-binding protein [Prescottella equi]NKT08053.1 ABC transporter substrate-binding protein [Prescottella equi]